MSAKGIYSVYLYNIMVKSQYTDSITGDVVFDMRCISNHIVDFAKENYPKSNMEYSGISYTTETEYTGQKVYRMDSGKRLFDQPSIYLNNYGLSTTPEMQDYEINNFTMSLWVYPISIKTRYSHFTINHLYQGFSEYIYLMYTHDSFQGITYYFSNANIFDTGTSVILNQWNHLAYTKQGNILRMYLNGVKISQREITNKSIPLKNISFGCMKQDASYIGEAVVILNQALWTGDTYEVPNTFLTGEKEFEDKYVIYTAPMNGWPNITGTVVCDFRANKRYLYETCCNKGRACNIDTYTPNIGLGTVTPIYDKYNNFEYSYELYKNTWVGINDNASSIKDSRNNLSDTWTACQWVKIQGAPTIPYYITGVGPTGCHALCVRFTNGNQLNYYLISYYPDNNKKNYLAYNSYEFGEIFESTTFQSIVGQWQFITWVKTSSKIYLFRNGVLLKSANISKTYSGVISGIGANVYCVMDPKMIIRYNNLVVINGQALWTANFTPPTGYLDEPKLTKAMILKRNNNDSDINLY